MYCDHFGGEKYDIVVDYRRVGKLCRCVKVCILSETTALKN